MTKKEMNLFRYIDSLTYKQIISVAIVLAVLFAVPTTVWLVNQQTRLYSSAHKENLPPQYVVDQQPFGSPSVNPPKIEKIRPFIGKVDDVVLILGHDFGQNPQQRAIFFGGVKAAEEDIIKWQDTMIEVMVPQGAVPGLVKVLEVDKEDTYSLPFTIYDQNTRTRVYWEDNNLMIRDGYPVSKVIAVLENGPKIEAKVEIVDPLQLLIEKLPAKDIYHLSLYDINNNLVSFVVDPSDFGF